MSKIKFGISGFDLPARDILLLARTMEALGFDSLWWGEHAVVPRGDSGDAAAGAMLNERTMLTDPLVMLAALTQATSSLKLGTAVLLAPLAHPLTLARATATLFDLVGDRFECGLGAGWLEMEFSAMGVPFNQRGRRLDDTLAILRKAWAGGAFEHKSAFFDIPRVQITPHATPVPLLIGGHSLNALERAARHGDGWIYTAPMELAKVQRLHDKLQDARSRFGREGRPFSVRVPSRSINPVDVEAVIGAGFTDIMLNADEAWPRGIDAAARVAHLTRHANEIGVGVR